MENMHVLPIERESGIESDDEATLIEAAKANPADFELLYQRYVTRVYRYLRTRLHSDEDAADMTQQVFLQALDALPQYRQQGIPFAAWLFQIARHATIDAHRRFHSTVSWDTFPEMLQPESEQNLETTMIRQENLSRLKTLLAQLDPSKRELLALRFAGGLSTPQIAAVVGKSPAAVKKQLTRIIQTLKEQYHDER